ncbi:hypothetical protein TPL01_05570 [Sulfuriferula plumbiphila]|uniref:Thioredoxin-dependent peroxiredoxin Bcp n=1 Tax=Sulfuriferula plumbiphila TaxID=171865 RepID=A0A512L4L4_9PROT|nr:redoxin domain-containing protein [Sulfuriferula plumbiphila]BBP03752.1 hypothetical protein SFPGR_11740 [Sulfuriferula plumbiphila]GEP29419.1 hypothetical protein TPL01_05570 [Sulfuriferula plumbiphila]
MKAGDKVPVFTLNDPDGKPMSSTALLARGPLVLSFYRGVWRRYGNLELQAVEAARPAFRAAGASLAAISPQTAANSRKSVRTNQLSFPVLSDAHNKAAAAFGLRFALPDYLVELYRRPSAGAPVPADGQGFLINSCWSEYVCTYLSDYRRQQRHRASAG